ncbi:hypothetical protein EBT16_10225, partial [bacterium]|nr:hypothetical protein [bacterium]
NEVLTPEELELRETERKRRKLQLTLEEETEELQRLEEEKRRIAGLRNPDFRIGQGGSGRKPSAASVFRENLQSTVQVSQGLGFLNLQQSNQSTVDTAQWMAQVQNRVVSPEGWEAGLYGKAFLIPLSSGPTGLSPRFIKAGFDVGSRFDLGTWVKVKPRVGFDYQSLLSSSDVGYRNLMGPRLELAGEFDLAKGEVIKSEVFFNLFDLNLSSSGPKNYQWGARLIYEFEASFLSFTQVVIGAEMARLNMALYTAQLTSTQMATFVGIQF